MIAEILCLGNELLIGRVVNSNATNISLELTKIGFVVTNHSVIRDDKKDILDTLQAIRKRNPDILVICGGLGLTHDDIQLESIADYLGRELKIDDKAVKLLEKRYNTEIKGVREKFVTLPEGSIPLNNSVGAAPGVITEVDDKYWFSVPGVPKEMKAILMEEIIPFLKSKFTDIGMVEMGFNAFGFSEPKILPITEIMQNKYPQFYYKSHPKKDKDNKPWLSLHVYGYGINIDVELKRACTLWRDLIQEVSPNSCSVMKNIFDNDFQGE